MANKNEVEMEIVEHIAPLSRWRNDWRKELNLVRWNGGKTKYDIRDWSRDHEEMGRGVTLTKDEILNLKDVLLMEF